jgi:hypothetical protein
MDAFESVFWQRETEKPSEIFKRHFSSCFSDDAYGLRNLDLIGEDKCLLRSGLSAFGCSLAACTGDPEEVSPALTDEQIDKITHRNAMRLYNFDLFKHHKRAELTVGALRAKARADGVDTTLISTGGAMPLAPGERPRPVTSADVIAMFAKHADAS